MATKAQSLTYQQILTHTDLELQRLTEQARFFGDLTAHLFQMAGLALGMRVLDIGCGTGDVSFLAAQFVGPSGQVIGVDRSPQAVEVATQRAAAGGLANVQFITADLAELVLDEPVDALIGRLILMYFADPAVLLRRLCRWLRPGGLVVFHELDLTAAKAWPRCDLYETSIARISETFTRAGADVRTGLKLAQIYTEAGLPLPEMWQSAKLGYGAASPAYSQVTQLTRTLLPLMERVGVATAVDIHIETLADRLRQEALANDATLVAPPFTGAWTNFSA